MIKTGIIGYGMSAKTFHEPFIRVHDAFTLTAIHSSKPTSELPDDVAHYIHLEDMLNDKTIDLIINTSPTGHHFITSEKVLRAQKHLVLEKPMTATVTEGQTLITLAKQHNVRLAVYHNRRLTGDFQTVKQLIENDQLGKVYRAELRFDRFRPNVRDRWRENAGAGSGILNDLGSHLIDQALQLFGMPEAVTARSIALRPHSPSVDYFHIQLHYQDKEVILGSSPYHNAPNPTFRLEGSNGTFVKYGLDPQEEQIKAGLSPLASLFAKESPDQYGILYGAEGKPNIIPTIDGNYLQFYDNLAQAITHNFPLDITSREALSVIKIIELAQQSSDLGKTISLIN